MSERYDGWTVRSEMRTCGKAGCRRCPHGPYFKGYKSLDGRTVTKYFGKKHPADVAAARQAERDNDKGSEPGTGEDAKDWIAKMMTAFAARQHLGLAVDETRRSFIREAYKRKVRTLDRSTKQGRWTGYHLDAAKEFLLAMCRAYGYQ